MVYDFEVTDRTLACDFKNAWIIAEKYHEEAQRTGTTSYDFAKSETWLGILNTFRTDYYYDIVELSSKINNLKINLDLAS